jgi:hypothetical protein
MLFKEIIRVYTGDHTEPKIQTTEELIVKSPGMYNYHSDLRG